VGAAWGARGLWGWVLGLWGVEPRIYSSREQGGNGAERLPQQRLPQQRLAPPSSPLPAGTVVSSLERDRARLKGRDMDISVKGFATIDDVSLINIEGTGMVGVPGGCLSGLEGLHGWGFGGGFGRAAAFGCRSGGGGTG